MERPTLLVVDDRDIDRKLVERALASEDYEITTASSGAEALDLLHSRLFDAALVAARRRPCRRCCRAGRARARGRVCAGRRRRGRGADRWSRCRY